MGLARAHAGPYSFMSYVSAPLEESVGMAVSFTATRISHTLDSMLADDKMFRGQLIGRNREVGTT